VAPAKKDNDVPADAVLLAALHEVSLLSRPYLAAHNAASRKVPKSRREHLLEVLEGMERQLLGNSLELPASEIGFLAHAAASNKGSRSELAGWLTAHVRGGSRSQPLAADYHTKGLNHLKGQSRLPSGENLANRYGIPVPTPAQPHVEKPQQQQSKKPVAVLGIPNVSRPMATRKLLDKLVTAFQALPDHKLRAATETARGECATCPPRQRLLG
jgi:hypothetical protein